MAGPMGIAFRDGDDLVVSLSEADGKGMLRIGNGIRNMLQVQPIESSEKLEFTDMEMFRGYPIAASERGIYAIRMGDDPIAYRRSLATDPRVRGLFPYSFDGGQDSLVAFGDNVVLSSPDGCNFGKMFEVGNEIKAIYPRNIREFYAGTSTGMYRTRYMYEFVNNTHNLTISEIKDLVDDMYPKMLSSVEDVIGRHIVSDHGTGTAISSIDSDAMDIQMSNVRLNKWQNITDSGDGELVVANDVVYRMEFGDQTNGDIAVSCGNFLSSWSKAKFSYVMKQWKSGVVELMLYILTTHTYYIGNLSGCPQYRYGQNYRPNISAMLDPDKTYEWTIPETTTEFTVSMDGSVYRMDDIIGVEACGNSLPLGIYREPDNAFQVSASMYNSMILPTIATEIPDLSSSGMRRFGFKCFGTDA